MWKSTLLALVGGLLVTAITIAGAPEDTLRYRGNFSYGHEVKVFCPDINSQCYWLSGDTPTDVSDSLRQLAQGESEEPYTPVCVLVEGVVDRSSPRTGFAAGYDGFIAIYSLISTCAESTVVIESDLQHHRWVLDSIDGEIFVADNNDDPVPDLDFGEQMQVTGNTGCNRISGKAELDGEYFQIPTLVSTRRLCSPPANDLERRLQIVLTGRSQIALDEDRNLVLTTDESVLRYRLSDWVK